MKLFLNILSVIFISIFSMVLIVKFLFPMLCYFLLIVYSFTFSGSEIIEEYQYQFDIESLQDNNVYVVSRYNVNNKQNYSFYREKDGRLVTGTTSVNDSSIVESDENPHVKVFYEFAGPFPKVERWLTEKMHFGPGEPYFNKHYEYHIPPNSVELEYNIDSK